MPKTLTDALAECIEWFTCNVPTGDLPAFYDKLVDAYHARREEEGKAREATEGNGRK